MPIFKIWLKFLTSAKNTIFYKNFEDTKQKLIYRLTCY